jgi:AcrR family transcriptional regulator
MASVPRTKIRSPATRSLAKQLRADANENGSRREALLEAGVEIFGTTPYDLISIDDIAVHAGVAHGLLFHYFKSKRGLYLAVLGRIADDLRAVHDVPDRSVSPARQVRAAINRHIDYIEQHPQTLLAYLSGGVGADPEARAILEESRWEGLNELLIVLGIEAPTTAIRMSMRGFVGFLDEAMIYCMTHDARIPRKQLLEMSIEVLVTALLLAGAGRNRGQLDPRALLSKSRARELGLS